jgi:hypothetical protein
MPKPADRENGFKTPLSAGMMQARVIALLQTARGLAGGDVSKERKLCATAVKWYCRFIIDEKKREQVRAHARLWYKLSKNTGK